MGNQLNFELDQPKKKVYIYISIYIHTFQVNFEEEETRPKMERQEKTFEGRIKIFRKKRKERKKK